MTHNDTRENEPPCICDTKGCDHDPDTCGRSISECEQECPDPDEAYERRRDER